MIINFLHISPQYIDHRITYWIEEGLSTNVDYENIRCKTLLIAGENDDFLPSKEEVLHLHSKIQYSKPLIIKNNAHSISLNHFDLLRLMNMYFI